MAEPTKEMVEEEAPGGDDVEVILNELSAAQRRMESWLGRGEEVITLYRGEGDGVNPASDRFNILWANVETQRPFIYSNTPKRIHDALGFAQLEDESLREDLENEIQVLESEVDQREFYAMFSGKHDHNDALLAIHAGAGGTDSQDWAEMLQRLYLRWMENHGFKTEILDYTEGEEAGLKSVTIAVDGRYAFGYLRCEKGVHRLVRLSPFDAAHRRHTSFALVEVLPQVEDDSEVTINPDELRIDFYRSSSAGGQNVQKNATAVRITHLPSGIVVTLRRVSPASQMDSAESHTPREAGFLSCGWQLPDRQRTHPWPRSWPAPVRHFAPE